MNVTWQMLGLAEVGNPVMISVCLWFITYALVAINFVLNFKEFKVWRCVLGLLMSFHCYMVIMALYKSYLAYVAGGGVV